MLSLKPDNCPFTTFAKDSSLLGEGKNKHQRGEWPWKSVKDTKC
jgi:hypothetical protein